MLVGIISDVHDNSRHLDKAIQYFNEKGIDMLIHCGDWCSPFILEMFKELKCPIKGVLGNGDPHLHAFIYATQNRFKGLNLEINERFLDITLDGKRFAVFHGDSEDLIKVIIESQLFDVFCHGHTHKSKIEKKGKTLVVNPGSLVGVYLPDKNAPITVAVYDTKSNKAEIISLK